MASVYYSFPVRLLVNHIKQNQVLLLFWIALFGIIFGEVGKFLGIQYLFLEPEYLNKVDFLSHMIIGVTLGGFTTAFHITSYIMDSHRFSFIGKIKSPFTTFSINNSLLPSIFLFTYICLIYQYQSATHPLSFGEFSIQISGLLSGFLLMGIILYSYFLLTNKDIFKYVVCKLDEKLKQNVPATRASAMNKLKIAKEKQIKVRNYFNIKFQPRKIVDDRGFYNRTTVIQVFDQNHFNLVIIELFIIALILIIGIFREYPAFQIPAAASLLLFFTMLVMIVGAFSYWFGKWSVSISIALFLIINVGVKTEYFSRDYQVFGLDYEGTRPMYEQNNIEKLNNEFAYQEDTSATLDMLRNWRAKFPQDGKPKMFITCVSGGGQRAALWTLASLQRLDSITGGHYMDHNVLITGASGGMIGASYFRELILQYKYDLPVDPYNSTHLSNISKDNLNSVIFNLLVNDLFIGNFKFEYKGLSYKKDRGYAFEQQLAINTSNVLDKAITSYADPEQKAIIPMMILAPTIMNDGRKLYIGSRPISYMTGSPRSASSSGIDFLRFFESQGSANLKFQSALRMNAAFPYITPNVSLPSSPTIKIMDAGITDNFGISDAVRFLYTFKDWVAQNTDEVVIISIRDSQKNKSIGKIDRLSLVDQVFNPISSIYNNFENIQNHQNDNQIQNANTWMKNDIRMITLEYNPEDNEFIKDRASLNWRLTESEKQSIIENVSSPLNQKKTAKIIELLKE